MGCASYWACRTCRQKAYLGYSSYSRATEQPQPAGHEGHDTLVWIDDAEWGEQNGHLYAMGPYGVQGHVIVEEYASYTDVTAEKVRDQ